LTSMRSFKGQSGKEKKPDASLSPEDELLSAKKKALSLLEFADRTEHELREKLAERGFSEASVDGAVAYVQSFHYLDDLRFSESFLLSRKDRKSVLELKMLLRDKGVSDENIALALEHVSLDEAVTVKELYRKKYGKKDSEENTLMEKALRYFAGKGFSYDSIRRGIALALEEEETAPETYTD